MMFNAANPFFYVFIFIMKLTYPKVGNTDMVGIRKNMFNVLKFVSNLYTVAHITNFLMTKNLLLSNIFYEVSLIT